MKIFSSRFCPFQSLSFCLFFIAMDPSSWKRLLLFFAILRLMGFSLLSSADAVFESGALSGAVVRPEQMGQPLDLLGRSADRRRRFGHHLRNDFQFEEKWSRQGL